VLYDSGERHLLTGYVYYFLVFSYNIAANIDPKNAGVLLVHLQGGGQGAPQGAYRDAGFTRDLAKNASGDDENVSSYV
jgi:hypothetical protein